MLETLKDEILLKLGPLHKAPNGYMKRNCMLCSLRGQGDDKRKRFGIAFSEDSVSINCFNCGFKAHWKEGTDLTTGFRIFLKKIGFTDDALRRMDFDIFRIKASGKVASSIVKYSAMSKWEHIGLPETALKISDWVENGCTDENFLNACLYAESRRIRNFENLYWSPDKALCKRLIIPFTFKRRTVGYTARYTYPIAKGGLIPKYMNYMPESFIYNYDTQMDYRRKTVVLCEGVLDAYQMDGISPLGSINKEQADMIDALNKRIVVIPDRDSPGKALFDMAIARRWSVAFPQWDPDVKDAAKAAERYGTIFTLQSILDTAEGDLVYLKVKREMMYEKQQPQQRRQ